MRRQTQGALQNIDAVLATTGATDGSPSSCAVKNRFSELSDEARTTATSNIRMQAQADKNAAVLYALRAVNAINAASRNAQQLDVLGLLSAGDQSSRGCSPPGPTNTTEREPAICQCAEAGHA
ncbi:MAG: hypothetical protein U1E20_02890 [Methylocystis sp.]|uniref:hypothetical protein n=1 Tax=Methylocystis sp. TaxID=1911079 RepID=UPI003931B0FA